MENINTQPIHLFSETKMILERFILPDINILNDQDFKNAIAATDEPIELDELCLQRLQQVSKQYGQNSESQIMSELLSVIKNVMTNTYCSGRS